MGRRGRRCTQLVDDLKEKKGYWTLKEELDHTLWRTRFGGKGYGLVIRRTTAWITQRIVFEKVTLRLIFEATGEYYCTLPCKIYSFTKYHITNYLDQIFPSEYSKPGNPHVSRNFTAVKTRATETHPEPRESSPHPHALFL